MDLTPFPVEIFARISSYCSPYSLVRLLLSCKIIYDGSHSNIIRSVDDKYILDQMVEIGGLNREWSPFKASLACVSSLARHLHKHGAALDSLTLTNNFYHNDAVEYDDKHRKVENIARDSVTHPLISVLLLLGCQLRELSVNGFLGEDMVKFLDVLDRSRLRALRVHNLHHVDHDVPPILADFVRRGCVRLEEFEYGCSRYRLVFPVLEALEVSTGSLRYLNVGGHQTLLPTDEETAGIYAKHLSKIAHMNKDTIEAICIAGPGGDSQLFALLGTKADSITSTEDIDKLELVCKQKYCVQLTNMMLHSFPLLFWLRANPLLDKLQADTNLRRLVSKLFEKLCSSLNKYNVRAIRSCLNTMAQRCESWKIEHLNFLSDLIILHIDQSIELGFMSMEYNFQDVISAASRILRVSTKKSPSLARAVHRALVCNIEPIKIIQRGGMFQVLDVGAEGGPLLDINRKLCGHGDPIFFEIMQRQDILFTQLKSLIAYPSFNSILCVGKDGSAIGAFLARLASVKDDRLVEVASTMLTRTAPRADRLAALQNICLKTDLVAQLMSPMCARLLARLAGDDWPLILTEDLLQKLYNDGRLDLLETLLEQVAKGPMGLGSVSLQHKVEMVDILWRYVFAWGDEEYFPWMAEMTFRHFPTTAPEWLADFIEGNMLPDYIYFAWDPQSIRKMLRKLRISW